MKKKIESIRYYLSSTVILNGFYALSVFLNYASLKENTVLFIVSFVLTILGLVTSWIIIHNGQSKKGSKLERFEIVTVKSLTEKNVVYFCLLVLVAVQLARLETMRSLILYLAVELMWGLYYVQREPYYLNPLFTMLDFKAYECTGNDAKMQNDFSNGRIFLVQGRRLNQNEVIYVPDFDKPVILLKKN